MSDSITYFWDEDFSKKEIEKPSEEVVNMLNLFRELSLEDKLSIKRLIKSENLLG